MVGLAGVYTDIVGLPMRTITVTDWQPACSADNVRGSDPSIHCRDGKWP